MDVHSAEKIGAGDTDTSWEQNLVVTIPAEVWAQRASFLEQEQEVSYVHPRASNSRGEVNRFVPFTA